jgi:alpha-L-rhamnosidase
VPNSKLQVKNLKCEYRLNPLGIDVLQPRLSWQLDAAHRGASQQAFQVVAGLDAVALLPGNAILWDSGRLDTDQSMHIPYVGPALQSRQRIYWRVRVWDENAHPTPWSKTAWFEMGLLDQADWQAHWIGNTLVGGPRTPVPNPFFRKDFEITGEIQSARLYVTSLGIYEATLNGQRVGEDVFTPGWTDYAQRVQYQVYDVAELLTSGENVLGAILGDGWYCGHVAWEGRQRYGGRPKLLAQLEITLTDGSTKTIKTDDTWETAVGPLLEADLVMGEAYDARLEFSLEMKGDKGEGWSPAKIFSPLSEMALVAQNTPTVRVQDELAPVDDPIIVWGWPHHNWIFDFGQNLVGRVRIKVTGERGTTITLRFGEMLDENEKLYTINLRSARQIDYYTLKGDPEGEIWESRFTSHGFRYVEIEGLTEKPNRDTLTAVVLHSDNPPAIEFECSDPLINQLQHNILWGWKGNSVDLPTDCPQRDERLGWTGDGQVFVKTATYLSDSAGFFTKWIQDMADAQLDYGAIPAVAPAPKTLKKSDGGAAWSDAFIIVPWTIWQQYGDIRILETHYDAMGAYMDYLVDNSPDLIRLLPDERELGEENEDWQIGGYGDWLAQDGNTDKRGLTPKNLIGTAFLAYDANLMAQIAAVLGKSEDANRFSQLFRHTRQAFIDSFITREGLLVGQTQTGYLLALYFDLVPEHLKEPITTALLKDIEVTRKNHMSSGFVGTPYINQVLTAVGRVDLAYTLLLQKTFPSWLYSVIHGATTIWERWDGWTEENGFQDPGMNSFNHYAYGAVGTWMYENIAGIRTDPDYPGFKHIILAPQPGGNLTYARSGYQSPYGEIKSAWRFEKHDLIWDVSIPPNTSATVHIPAGPNDQIFEGDTLIQEAAGMEFLQSTDQARIYKINSGSYNYKIVKVQD